MAPDHGARMEHHDPEGAMNRAPTNEIAST